MITSEQAGILLERWGQPIKKWGSQGDDLRVILTAIRNKANHIDNITSFINKEYNSTPPGTSTPSRALYDWMNKNESNNMDGISEFLKEIKERNPYLKASSSQVVNTKNLITVSSQLVYPFWYDHNPSGAFARNTVIHLFRADENSPWSIIALPENDRYAPDAAVGKPNEFEQRYFKFVSGAKGAEGKGVQFSKGSSPEEAAQNAFEALLKCYPVENQNVPNFSKELLTEQFKSSFTQRNAPDFGEGIDRRAILPPEMLASEERARKTLKDGKISVIDDKKPIQVNKIDDNHMKVVFGETTFNLRVVGDEIIVFADTKNFNSLHGGMLRLGNNASDWKSQISDAWLIQQAAIRLGTQYNPETKHKPPYTINTNLPVSQICAVAKALLAPHKGLLFDKLQSIYKYGENGGSRIHFNKVNTDGLNGEVKGKYVDKDYEPLIGDGLKRAILDNFKGQLELCKNETEVEACVNELKGTGEFTILATHQRPQTFKFTESKTSAIQALETMCSQAKNIINPNAKQDLKNDNENENKSSMSFKP